MGFAIITFVASNDSEYVFYFPEGAFTTPGTYSAYVGGPTYNVGTLILTPEPAAALLAVVGLFLCGVKGRLLTKRSIGDLREERVARRNVASRMVPNKIRQ